MRNKLRPAMRAIRNLAPFHMITASLHRRPLKDSYCSPLIAMLLAPPICDWSPQID
jgi:hypothetical protein